jgi:hypothetical protein
VLPPSALLRVDSFPLKYIVQIYSKKFVRMANGANTTNTRISTIKHPTLTRLLYVWWFPFHGCIIKPLIFIFLEAFGTLRNWTEASLCLTKLVPLIYLAPFCGLYYKNISMIVNEACTIVQASSPLNVLHLSLITLASIVNYNRKWRYNLERHLLMTITIVICL